MTTDLRLAATIARATWDPGSYVKRHKLAGQYEHLADWQQRAVLKALRGYVLVNPEEADQAGLSHYLSMNEANRAHHIAQARRTLANATAADNLARTAATDKAEPEEPTP
jgi:hypothetical protein